MDEERIKKLANDLWYTIVDYNATQEGVLAAMKTAYQMGYDDCTEHQEDSGPR